MYASHETMMKKKEIVKKKIYWESDTDGFRLFFYHYEN